MGFDHVDLIYANPPPDGLAVADMVAAVAGLLDRLSPGDIARLRQIGAA
jgi:hypothetical protein